MLRLSALWSYQPNALDKVKHLYSLLTDIGFSNIDVVHDISILIGADNPKRYASYIYAHTHTRGKWKLTCGI